MDIKKLKNLLKIGNYYIRLDCITGFAFTKTENNYYCFSIFFDGTKIDFINEKEEFIRKIEKDTMNIYLDPELNVK